MRIDMFLGAVSLAAGIAGSEFTMRRQARRLVNRQVSPDHKTVFVAQKLPNRTILRRTASK